MKDLIGFLADHAGADVHPLVESFARDLAHRTPGTLVVLAYGSALRDSSPSETLIDFYVLVDQAQNIHPNPVLRTLGNWVPPNVHYAEHNHEGETARCKYAVMTLDRFHTLVRDDVSNPYLWARFCQPSRIIWSKDVASQWRLAEALAIATRTAYGHGLFLSHEAPWQSLFENTYRTELRPERAGRAALIVQADASYYHSITALLKDVKPAASSWAAKRLLGKFWSVLRLVKAAFTFQGGADYAAWKIERHSGVKIPVTDWQRKHPILAGLMLLPKLLRKNGLR